MSNMYGPRTLLLLGASAGLVFSLVYVKFDFCREGREVFGGKERVYSSEMRFQLTFVSHSGSVIQSSSRKYKIPLSAMTPTKGRMSHKVEPIF